MRNSKYAVFFICYVLFMVVGSISESAGQTVSDEELLKDASGVELQEIISSYQGDKAVMVNVWATWCAPCIEEFPYIVDLQKKYDGELHVVFISADFPGQRSKTLEFLQEQNVDWTTYFKTGKDQAFIEALSSDWSGALPFTKVLNKDGEIIASWEQGAEYEKFERYIKKAINN